MEIYRLKEIKLKVAFEVFFFRFFFKSSSSRKKVNEEKGLYGNYNDFFYRNVIDMRVWLHSHIG